MVVFIITVKANVTLSPPNASVDPPLKPYQPINRINVPRTMKG